MNPIHAEPWLSTIGYEGAEIDDFVATLKAARVSVLIDIRDVPISRKRGFSKNALAVRLEAEGLEYFHFKALGDPKPGRDAARAGRYGEFQTIFRQHLDTDVARTALRSAALMAAGRSICLLCFERDHRNCHRHMVAEAISSAMGIEIRHLGVRRGLASSTTGIQDNRAGTSDQERDGRCLHFSEGGPQPY